MTVIGSNGAGKSTLFNAIAGSFLCDSGRILLDGKDITYQKEHKRAKQIGRIFQDPTKGTAPDLTVEENMALAYSKSTRNILASAHRKKILRFSARCSRNSTWGWKTVCAPKWGSFPAVSARRSHFDEHDGHAEAPAFGRTHRGARPGDRAKVLDITKEIVAENHITTMMITHNINQALNTGNRTIMLSAGQIVLDLKGEERAKITIPELMEMYQEKAGKALDNDRMLLSEV